MSNSSRRKIATHTKLLVSLNALPAQYLAALHPTQISRYKNNFCFSQYFGQDLLDTSNDLLLKFRQLNQSSFDKKMVFAYLRLAATLRNVFASCKGFHKILLQSKSDIVQTVLRVKTTLSLHKCARVVGVSESTLRSWMVAVRAKCQNSLINLCRKVHPNQLLAAETDAMKKLLRDDAIIFWPLVSVYHYARNKKLVTMALSTWYKYASLLAIARPKPKSIKHYGKSIQATLPNEYWHADVTQFKTADGQLHYIYQVVDNFSKMILSWAIDVKLSAQIRVGTFREALKTAVTIHASVDAINLIVDGGSENNNKTVDEFMAAIEDIEISKLRALKDVCFSNSFVARRGGGGQPHSQNLLPQPSTH